MNPRRRSTHRRVRASAGEDAPSVRDRFDRMEEALRDVHVALEIQFKRIAALQAQLDHLAAKVTGRYDAV